ncbi:hypothetical protein [Chryseobacterium sp. c4a]|uniref:hypothetical protein n=1 Tax=Chryseobacterium sp. c4a TaxID=1573582 RepID=UPI00135C61A1|nr:hypothetical protein [Chryseobacterium sp. c4a]
MKKNAKKINLSTLKVIDQKEMATLHGGLQQMEEVADIGLTSVAYDYDKGSLCSVFKDIDF